MIVNKERIQLLVAALRSGDYQQTTAALRDDDGFCCLGVACDVYHKETGKGGWAEIYKNGYEFMGHDSDLPEEVAIWFGFSQNDPVIIVDEKGQATWHNDNSRKNFDEIAGGFENLGNSKEEKTS